MENNSHTTQYKVLGQSPDGTWRPFPQTCYSKEQADTLIEFYKKHCGYSEFRVMKRTVVTNYGPWEAVDMEMI